MQVLRLGSKSPDVGRVQRALNERMLPPNNTFTRPPLAALVDDDKFGDKTRAMVMEFQRLNKVTADGIVGPVTSYLLYPFIVFSTVLAGSGLLIGSERGGLPIQRGQAARNILARVSPRLPVALSRTRLAIGEGEGEGEGEDGEPEGLGIDASVAPGFKREFQPWFVLNPGEPEGARSFTTVTAEATIARKKGFEFGGEFEFSRALATQGVGSTWKWEGTLFGKYTGLKAESGPFSVGLSPIVEAKIREGLQGGAAAGAEAEATLSLSKDLLELSVGGKAGAQWDINEGNVQVGAEVTVGLKLKWEIVRFPRRK